MKIHRPDELRQMFDAFGLGSEEDRKRFLRLAELGRTAEARTQAFRVHFDNASVSGVLCVDPEDRDAELARNP